MKSSSLLRAVSAAAVAAILTVTAAAPAHAALATSLRIPITGTIGSSVGPLTVTGTAHLVVLPPNPIQPGDPTRVHTNLVKVTASNTGTTCTAVGASQSALPATTSSFTGHYTFVPSNPVVPSNPLNPSDPCAELGRLSILYQLAVGENGAITGTAVANDPVT